MNTNRMSGNGSTKSTASMMHEALDKLIDQASGYELRDVRMITRSNPVSGRHVHASGSVRLKFQSTVTEGPLQLPEEIAINPKY